MNNKVFTKKFCLGMAIYAAAFLLMMAVGLLIWWDFIDIYEQARPKTAINSYVESLAPEQICMESEEFLSQLDTGIQSREESCKIVADALKDDFHTAKKSRESTDERQVYALLSGDREIGEIAIQAGDPGKYGFRIWKVDEATFDLSFLQGKAVEVTVPESFTVKAGGTVLNDTYIIRKNIPFEALEDFYDGYLLPSMVTYHLDSFLGVMTPEVLDGAGNPVSITPETDMNQFLPACTEAESQEIETFIPVFLEHYVNFSGGAKNSLEINFKRLKQTLATDGELAKLFYSALKGQRFTGSRKDTVEELAINQTAVLDDNRYFCDMSFRVKTIGRSYETVYTDNNMRLILVREENGLKVEAMTRY